MPSPLWNKLCHFLGRRGDTPPVANNTPSLDLPWSPGVENTIQDMLDSAGFPWRASCHDLIARFGLFRHPAYDSEEIPIEPCPLGLDGLLYPVSPRLSAAPYRNHVPPWFRGNIWIENNPLVNIRHAHRQIAELLGPAPIGIRNNTISSIWNSGPARVSLTVWPKKLQSSKPNIPAHERDRRLETACSVFIEPGYRRPMNEQEREWLKEFTPLAEVRGMTPASTLDALWANPPEGRTQEFLREPPVDQDNFLGQIGLSSDSAALIVCASQLHIIPTGGIAALKLQKIRPAKGGGGASLSLVYRSSNSPDAERQLGLSGSFGAMDALDDLASHLGKALDRPIRIPEPQYDC